MKQAVNVARLEANRANAKKSTGPKTPAGKARSAHNAVRHGLCSTTFVLHNEDIAEYREHENAYIRRFGPRDKVELDLVQTMARATFTQLRAWNAQNETINLRMESMEATVAAEYSSLAEHTRIATALAELAKEPTLQLLLRYEAGLANQYRRALKLLRELRATTPLLPPGAPVPQDDDTELRNEPNEAASPSDDVDSNTSALPAGKPQLVIVNKLERKSAARPRAAQAVRNTPKSAHPPVALNAQRE